MQFATCALALALSSTSKQWRVFPPAVAAELEGVPPAYVPAWRHQLSNWQHNFLHAAQAVLETGGWRGVSIVGCWDGPPLGAVPGSHTAQCPDLDWQITFTLLPFAFHFCPLQPS